MSFSSLNTFRAVLTLAPISTRYFTTSKLLPAHAPINAVIPLTFWGSKAREGKRQDIGYRVYDDKKFNFH
jgi:hypothetical protein